MSLEVFLSKNVFQYSGSAGRGKLRSSRINESKVVLAEGTLVEDSVQVVLVSATDGLLGGYMM